MLRVPIHMCTQSYKHFHPCICIYTCINICNIRVFYVCMLYMCIYIYMYYMHCFVCVWVTSACPPPPQEGLRHKKSLLSSYRGHCRQASSASWPHTCPADTLTDRPLGTAEAGREAKGP